MLTRIEQKLDGMINPDLKFPLSEEGVVDYLIKESVSIDNLSQMYVGWAAYM